MAEYIEREVTCSDCFHVDVCENRFSWLDQEDNTKHRVCHRFKNKADVVEVRHGYWKHTDLARHWVGKDECSECTYHTFDRRDLSQLNYCPNCGAKMDGDKK